MAFVVRETAVTDRANEIVAIMRAVTVVGSGYEIREGLRDDIKVGRRDAAAREGAASSRSSSPATRAPPATSTRSTRTPSSPRRRAWATSSPTACSRWASSRQSVTDWVGAGTVRKFGVRFAAIVRLRDDDHLSRTASLGAKYGKDLVDLELWAENQRGEKVMTGKATVAIPPRG